MTVTESPSLAPARRETRRITARVLLLGERLDTAMLERGDVISTAPLAFRTGDGCAVLFRYGIVVLFGFNPLQEAELVNSLRARVIGAFAQPDIESALIEVNAEPEEQIVPGGPIIVRDLAPARMLVVADALAKNVALARDEREVTKVFEVTEPFTAELARRGRFPSNRREMLRTIGQALLVHHRISGRVEVEEKPDVLWDHPELERLYARLVDEYELKERAGVLERKLRVIEETARALTDIIDTERSVRLEATIVALIVVEVLVAFYELFVRAVG